MKYYEDETFRERHATTIAAALLAILAALGVAAALGPVLRSLGTALVASP